MLIPEVTDDDVAWVCDLLRLPRNAYLDSTGADAPLQVLKSCESMDVAACPGSGKTTLLVAKLAILAKTWPHRTHGMCVLSHTNAARREIETKLGCTSVGHRLLSYPHFVGTIHAFANEYLALPWLRSRGRLVRTIDTEVTQRRRWYLVPPAIRHNLRTHEHIDESSIHILDLGFNWARVDGTCPVARNTPSYLRVQDACRQASNEGYHCHDEMLLWANDLIDNCPEIVTAARARFPILFIDEAQDSKKTQSELLQRLFMDGSGPVVRQRFGDANQSIFDYDGEESSCDGFPDDTIKRRLSCSHRFGSELAHLANPLAVSPCNLEGHGPQLVLASGMAEGPHTVFIFGDSCRVLDAYAELLARVFSADELRKGTFTAVGQVHRDVKDDNNPRHVPHYWPAYDANLVGVDPRPHTFVQQVRLAAQRADAAVVLHPAVNTIADGVLRLARLAEGGVTIRHSGHSHRQVRALLEQDEVARRQYEQLIDAFVMRRETPTAETWAGEYRDVVLKVASAAAGAPVGGLQATEFLEWPHGLDVTPNPTRGSVRDNVFRCSKGGKDIAVRVGSIHSVKGETHTATLVLETHWYAHCLEQLQPWLIGRDLGAGRAGLRQRVRLRIHYVAMTRPTHLLCLAMKKSSFEDASGNLDNDRIQELKRQGWNVEMVD